MSADTEKRERIEEILVDTYDEYEQASAWEVAFQDDVQTPFRASLFGVSVEVQGFQAGDDSALQCLAVGEGRKRWVGVGDLDPKVSRMTSRTSSACTEPGWPEATKEEMTQWRETTHRDLPPCGTPWSGGQWRN